MEVKAMRLSELKLRIETEEYIYEEYTEA